MTLVVGTDGNPDTSIDRVRSTVREVDPLLAVFEVKTMEQVLRQGIWLTTLGLGAGAALVFAAAPLLHDLPVTVRPPDTVLVVPLAAGLAGITLLACLLPAIRAARVDPMSVLRSD